MAKVITCLQDLLEGGTLQFKDVVFFNGEKYEVRENYLYRNAGHCEEKILTDTNFLSKKDFQDFCTKTYGYKSIAGIWPVFRYWDYKSLTRCVAALYVRLEQFLPPKIEITLKISGKESKLSDISEETLLNIRKSN